ncbi:hypothetical protein [Actinomadura xylanilytica]|uniref:hypothetical protein n=1 Tax=Actinomadura xylanilytica TaxID=887459 RepID=UPI00255A950B|nr:hypothetical protein [Actinomadura xylanilytica]
MAELTAYEAGWRKVCEDLDDHPGIEVLQRHEGEFDTGLADAAAAWETLVHPQKVTAPAGLGQCQLRFHGLGRQWQTVAAKARVAGEFFVGHIGRAGPPAIDEIEPWGDDDGEFPASQLRVIDVHPYTGTGQIVGLRLLPGGGEPEIWWTDRQYGDWKLDIGYREYLNTLQTTKGAFMWQLLFTQAPLGEEEFASVRRRLEDMLEVLPALFPEHDYEPLRNRLAARLQGRYDM